MVDYDSLGTALVVGIAVALGSAVLTRDASAGTVPAGIRDALDNLQSQITSLQQGPSNVDAIAAVNAHLSQLQTGAGTEISEAFSGDLALPGGLISSVGTGETGGGNPEGLLQVPEQGQPGLSDRHYDPPGGVDQSSGPAEPEPVDYSFGGSNPFGGSSGGSSYVGGPTSSTGF